MATGYFVAGRLGLAVPATSGNVSPLWPAAGVALAAILVRGYAAWSAVAVAAFLVNFLTGVPILSSVTIAGGNAAGPVIGAWLLRRFASFDPSLARLRDALALILLGAFAGTAVSATVGTVGLRMGAVPAWSGPETTWLMWWLGDAMGVLVVAPLVLTLPFLASPPARSRGWELGALIAVTVACGVLAFSGHPYPGGSRYGVVALTFPFLLVWGATRFEVVGASIITASIAAVAAASSAERFGPFAVGSPARSAGLMQFFITVIAVSGLCVAALIVERTRLIRQRAERDAARQGEERLREIAETANEGMWMLDSRLLTSFVNRRIVQMLGYPAAEMLGQPVTAFMFEADVERKLAELERRKRGVSEEVETRLRRKDGGELWARMSTTGSFDDTGRFTGALAMVSDITEQRRLDERERASRQEIMLLTRVVEQTADSVLVTTPDGVIEYVNPAFESTTGYARDEVIGRTPAILKSGHHDREFYGGLWSELQHGRTFRGTLVNRKKSGALYWAEQTITPIRNADNAITHFVSVLKDVTELRRKHEQEVQLRLAREVQRRFYQNPARVPGLDLAAASYPATETGGDYFDFIPAAGGSVYVVIGDASGHGLGAALVMTLTRAYVRSLAALDLEVGEVLARMNRMLFGDLEENRFVTLLVAHIDPTHGMLHYANAGHVPGIVIGPDGARPTTTMNATGMPLGLFAAASFEGCQLPLLADDVLVLVTDGVTESARADGEEFGAQRALECVRSYRDRPANAIAEGVCHAARSFAGTEPQADDVTAVVVKVAAVPAPHAGEHLSRA